MLAEIIQRENRKTDGKKSWSIRDERRPYGGHLRKMSGKLVSGLLIGHTPPDEVQHAHANDAYNADDSSGCTNETIDFLWKTDDLWHHQYHSDQERPVRKINGTEGVNEIIALS